MKTTDALKVAGVVFAGVAAYLVVTRAAKATGTAVEKVTKALTEIATKDLNPASTENVVYKAANVLTGGSNSGPDAKPIGVRAWEFFNPGKVAAEKALTTGTSHVANTAAQVDAYSYGGPSVGVYAMPAPDQNAAEDARLARKEALLAAPTYAKNLFDMHMGTTPNYWN